MPGRYATRFDLFGLNQVKKHFAGEFLNELLSKSKFSFDISFDGIDLNELDDDKQKKLGLVAKRLNSIYYENEDTFKEHGIRTFEVQINSKLSLVILFFKNLYSSRFICAFVVKKQPQITALSLQQ